MEFQYYFRMAQRGWWIILCSILIAVSTSLYVSYFLITPKYEAQAKFIVSPNVSDFERESDLINSMEALDKRSIVATYGEVIKSREILLETMEDFNVDPEDYAAYEISVTVLPDANILQLTIRGPHPETVSVLANGIGNNAISYITNLYSIYNINFLDYAFPATEPSSPQPIQNTILAFLLGAIVGFGLAILRDQLTTSLERIRQWGRIDNESQAFTKEEFDRKMRTLIANNPDANLSLGLIFLNGIEQEYNSLPQTYINHIMRKVTNTLKFHLRGNDIVGRYSPLQFVVLLPSTPGKFATETLKRICVVLDNPIDLERDGDLKMSIDPRIGVAELVSGEPYGELVAKAEKALEISMQSGEKTNFYTSKE